MPKEWYEYKANKIEEGDDEETIKRKEFNLRILADKKPYFFNYIYPQQMKKYKNFINNSNKNCLRRFGVTIDELKLKENKIEAEDLFLKYYDIKMPVESNPCVMNKICWRIEKEFDRYLNKKIKYNKFDYSILMTDKPISKRKYNKIAKLYEEYNKELCQY